MSDNVTILSIDDDDDKTVFQTDEDRRQIELDILGSDDDDTTEFNPPHQLNNNRPRWQQTFD